MDPIECDSNVCHLTRSSPAVVMNLYVTIQRIYKHVVINTQHLVNDQSITLCPPARHSPNYVTLPFRQKKKEIPKGRVVWLEVKIRFSFD